MPETERSPVVTRSTKPKNKETDKPEIIVEESSEMSDHEQDESFVSAETFAEFQSSVNNALKSIAETMKELRSEIISQKAESKNNNIGEPSSFSSPVASLAEQSTNASQNNSCNNRAANSIDNNLSSLHPRMTSLFIHDLSDITFQSFWRHAPKHWFDLLEQRFRARNITTDDVKFLNLVKNLSPDSINEHTS